MLSEDQLSILQDALFDETQTFTALSRRILGDISNYFSEEGDLFLAGCALVLLLNASALTQGQKLNALFLLYEIYNGDDVTGNPFLPVFVEHVENDKIDTWERNFAGNILFFSQHMKDSDSSTSQLKFLTYQQLSSRSSRSYIEDGKKKQMEVSFPELNLALFKDVIQRITKNSKSMFSHISLPPIMPIPDEAARKIHNPKNFVSMEKADTENPKYLSITGKDIVLTGFRPEVIRPPPPIYQDARELSIWADPLVDYALKWDESMCLDNTEETQIISLIRKACKTSLQTSQQDRIKAYAEKNPKVVRKAGVSKEDIPELVRNNYQILVVILLHLYNTPNFREYLDKFNDMDISLRAMEVVNTLTSLVKLPGDFLYSFVSNCMIACQQCKEKYERPRLVGFACIFFESLIMNDVIDISNIYPEMEAFCLEFASYKGASDLFQKIKKKMGE